MKDTSPEAFAKVVDQLLDSPHYGERWARHWLDLARFAESHGFEHDYDRPTRLPLSRLRHQGPQPRPAVYDTFVKWQLAGDEFAPNDHLALMATGFLAAGVHSTQITKNEVEKHRYDELDDMLATTGTAMLGLTVGCARCHDHKFDPIPQARLLPHAVDVHDDGSQRSESRHRSRGVSRRRKRQFDREHAPLVKALATTRRTNCSSRFAEWEKTQAGKPLPATWIIPTIADMQSTGGATFTKQGRRQRARRAARIRRAKCSSSPSKRPYGNYGAAARSAGRSVARQERTGPSEQRQLLPDRCRRCRRAARGARATIVQTEESAVDLRAEGPRRRRRHRRRSEQYGLGDRSAIRQGPRGLVRVREARRRRGRTTVLTVTLRFNNNVGHGIGRPRLSLTNSKEPLELREARRKRSGPDSPRHSVREANGGAEGAIARSLQHLDPGWQKLSKLIQDHLAKAPKPNVVKALIASEGVPPVQLHTQGEDFFQETHFLRRGDPNQKEAVASPSFLQVLITG